MVYTTKDLTVYKPKGVLTTKPLPELNIPDLNLDNLILQLQQTVNSGKWVVFKGWQNDRLRLDAERQNWIIKHIQNLGLSAEELAKTKASIILSAQMVSDLVNGYYEEARQKFELSAQQHLTALKQEHENRRKMDDEALMRQLHIQEKAFLNEALKWQAEEQKHKSELAKLRASLAEKIISEFSFKNIDARQVFILGKSATDKQVDILSKFKRILLIHSEPENILIRLAQKSFVKIIKTKIIGLKPEEIKNLF